MRKGGGKKTIKVQRLTEKAARDRGQAENEKEGLTWKARIGYKKPAPS
jgi:hypothetical protein